MAGAPPSGRKYKIKLDSGRVLGPLDLERIALLIRKNRIIGTEVARLHPDGEWRDINTIPELADMLLARLESRLASAAQSEREAILAASSSAATRILADAAGAEGATIIVDDASAAGKPTPISEDDLEDEEASESESETGEKTRVADIAPIEKTRVVTGGFPSTVRAEPEATTMLERETRRKVAQEPTVAIARPFEPTTARAAVAKHRKITPKDFMKAAAAAILLGVVWFELFIGEPEKKPMEKIEAIRPRLPVTDVKSVDPARSLTLYNEAVAFYVKDTVQGYIKAADKFREAAGCDPENVKANALLASSYLNLIDSSNKDENYFNVISQLIERSRKQSIDLPETVVADVEFYITVNKPEAAQNRIIEYTKSHQKFGPDMFYYLALTFYHRGDANSAARYLSQIPENQILGPRMFYLAGQIAEKLQDNEEALKAYTRAIQKFPDHAKSKLRIADILYHRGRLKEAKALLEFITTNNHLLAPKDLAYAYYLASLFYENEKKWEMALAFMERAVRLEKENHDYLLELYTLRGKSGEQVKDVRNDARMYFYLSEGEKLVKLGRYQEALGEFLQARQTNDRSPLPLVKAGDMFMYLHDLRNARLNYRLATERAASNIDVWSKYIKVLIESYEWKEAEDAMSKFRNLPVPQSAIDKAAADMYQKQGRYAEAQAYYRKAMARDSIDSDVYIAYAKSLMSTRNFNQAPFFFALARRFDPLNADALIGIAKCTAEITGIDSAITMLQDELQKDTGSRAQLLTAIAELQIQKGAIDLAQANIEQALVANPDYAMPYKLQAEIFMNNQGRLPDAVNKALDAYKSYSDRNPSDLSGYLERYRIFMARAAFDRAEEELKRIFAVNEKYPRYHYFKGYLFEQQGNPQDAIREYQKELETSRTDPQTVTALGRLLVKQGNPVEGLKHLTVAMGLAPNLWECKYWAALANFQLKNYAGSLALFKAALQLDSGNPLIYKSMGEAYRATGDEAGARQAFSKYLNLAPDAPDREQYKNFH